MDTPTIDTFTSAEQATRERIAELEDRRQRLAPEGDSPELADVETELLDGRQELERAVLAQREVRRRAEESSAAAATKRRLNALDRARELGAQRDAAAQKIDATLRDLAENVVLWNELSRDQANALRAAGERDQGVIAMPLYGRVESAMARAAIDAGVPVEIKMTAHRRLDSKPLALGDRLPEIPEA